MAVLTGTVLTLGACGGSEPAQPERPTPAVVIAPGTEDEPVTLRVNSDLRPPFESHEGYAFIIGGIGDGVGVGQALSLAQVHNPELPTDHEIRTVVPTGGWLAVGGAFYHYIRSEYKGLTFTMVFGRKVTVPLHDPGAFIVQVGDRPRVTGRNDIMTIHSIEDGRMVASISEINIQSAYSVGDIIQMPNRVRWKILAIEPAKDDLPAYAEIVRLPEDQAAGAKLRSIPLR